MNRDHDNGHEGDLPWDDPRLRVPGDDERKALYRLLQSWYREAVLEMSGHGISCTPPHRCVGSMLHPDDVRATPGLNLMPEARNYALERVSQVNASGGFAEACRFELNMLSSMPLCFSVFGTMRGLPDKGLGLVRELFDADAEEVQWIECEWKPQSDPLRDGTAFDAAILVRRADDTRHLIGIETKYTEPFSRKEYLTSRYVNVHDASGWFRRHSIVRCAGSASNQLWRSVLLAAACEKAGEVGRASVAVLALANDPGAEKALQVLHWGLKDHQDRCRFVTLESLVTAARREEVRGELAPDWGERFDTRYLNVASVRGGHGDSPAPLA